MSRKDEPAYPVPDTVCPNGQVQYGSNGLTIREEFIKAAMQGHIAAGSNGMPWPERIVELAIQTADATLAAMEGK